MLFSIKNRENLENLNELVSLQDQIKEVRLKDKLGKQKFHENRKKVFEPVTDTIKNTSENVTKTITETSNKNNQAIENLNIKFLKIMIDRGILATYLMSLLSKITNLENTSQFELVKHSSSSRVIDLLIQKSIPTILHDNVLTFRDTGKVFEGKVDLLKMIAHKNNNIELASLLDKKIMYDFAKEMHLDV